VPIPEETIQDAIEREFQCNRCGHCCKGDGVVDFGAREADRMADFLDMPRKKFLKQYAIAMRSGRWHLKDQNNEEQWCIFLQQDAHGLYGCRVNPAKPDQCASFPAKWRNPDSFITCSGLRTLMRSLREREGAKTDS